MITIRNLCRTLLLVAISILLPQHLPAQTRPVDSLISGEYQFALDLYMQLKGQGGNLFFSPYSISTCLSAAYVGARGETANQMAKTLEISLGPEEIGGPMHELEQRLNARQENGIQLYTANGLWAQQNHPFLPSFIDTVQNDFGATVKQVDFRTGSEPARQEINAWVSDKTKGRITDLLQENTVSPNTDLVLVNAIYFKGKWKYQFQPKQTTDASFTTASGQKVQAHFMNNEAQFSYFENSVCRLLELPYSVNAPLSMVVLLPDDIDGLNKLQDAINAQLLVTWLNAASTRKVNVFFPKFKITSGFDLGGTLRGMGMRYAFSRQADFSGMDGTKFFYISAAVHKAYVDVNEEGTEAAAVTGLVTSHALDDDSPLYFRADHPFIFLIRDNRSGCILFLGRVNDPTK